ncbi:hypothetical protein [Mycolicibacterium grossiae]|uniref:Uncharacterized protein n=1 Tax=Mycolicibacterium grossiae TaxID=1552759 RepID=A0A1E8Q9C1_9MYCO|nr:hypothetical protein [Mycolicibacterium grossiae]OFJ55188.1 hypothetical protein BEL07_03165 [Mycolicibacterium grossiae]QEM46105.1 hypothetical protein FZ046_16230 [Mycolicibacterium grossiae]
MTGTLPALRNAVTFSEWCDVGTEDGAWRTIRGERRGKTRHYGYEESFAEATCIQNEDGSVEWQRVITHLDVHIDFDHHEDHQLLPDEARLLAAKVQAAAAELTALALALQLAANEVEVWTR